MFSSKEGLDEIPFCLDISLLWGCWTGSKQRHISDQSYKPVEDNNHQQKATTNLILKKYTKPIYCVSSKTRHICPLFSTPSGLLLFYLDCQHVGQWLCFLHVCASLTKRKSDSFYRYFEKMQHLLALLFQVGTLVQKIVMANRFKINLQNTLQVSLCKYI